MKAYPYLIQGKSGAKGERLKPLDPKKKEFDEKWLQDFLIFHSDALPTYEIEPIFYPLAPIGKEVQVTEGRIDILYLSASGYPVIAETKLWRNPESKRGVVAQVLDMAFSFSKWDYDQLEEQTKRFTKMFFGKEKSIVELLEEMFGEIEMGHDEFHEHVSKNLNLGRFLVTVVGDRIRSSSLDIFNELNKYPGLGLELAMIELECFKVGNGPNASLLIVPRIAKKTEIIERSIVEVKIQHDEKPEVTVTQEKAREVGGKVRRLLLTEAKFWEKLKEVTPNDYEKIRKFVDQYKDDPLIEVTPGTNGLRFRRILSESDRSISLFFITTDSRIHVRLQAPMQQFESFGFDTQIVDKFGKQIKKVLNGYSSPFREVNLDAFSNALSNFIEKVDQQDSIGK